MPVQYLASNSWITSDDERVVNLAKLAVGMESDPWKKAQAIERWVHRRMRVDNVAPFVPARGGQEPGGGLPPLCTADGRPVPGRGSAGGTAIGMIYVLDRRTLKPSLGFHMWTEVWIGGRWLGLDATLGLGHVGAGHIKVTDHSWHNTQSLTPLLPVTRMLGKLAVEVEEIDRKPVR